MQVKVRVCRLGLQPRLNADPVCDTQRLWGGTAALRKCRTFTFHAQDFVFKNVNSQ